MSDLKDIELPLYNAFIKLMKLEHNQPHKGIDPGSYLMLIDVLQQGYGLNSFEELLFLCKKIWLKPFHRGNAAVTEQVVEELIIANLGEYRIAIGQQFDEAEKINENAGSQEVSSADQKEKQTQADDIEQADESEDADKAGTEKEDEIPDTANDKKSRFILNIEEQDADASLDDTKTNGLFSGKEFQFNFSYLPVSPRFIEQTVRSLRYKVRGTGRPVIDFEATVNDAGSKGYFDGWKFNEEDDFVTAWTLVFDRGGSMIAFHALQDAIKEAAFRGTMANLGDVFYFRNTAKKYLYTNEQRTNAVQLSSIANGPLRNILIVSDAGAARSSYSEDRIQDTYTMLYLLRKHRIAWLNPLPRERWKLSSAGVIAEFVNMFEPGNDYTDDFGNIVRSFKSKIITSTTL